MNVTREEKMAEAIERMKALRVFKPTIKQFKDDGYISISEPPFGAFYWAEGDDLKRIREFEMELELKARVATRDIDDIMCTALEGGITSWCRAAKPVGKMLGEYGHEQIARGGSLMLYDAESSDKWELTLDKFLRGLALAIESGAAVTIDAESGYIDTSDVDAECADMIIQFALFGDLVFG